MKVKRICIYPKDIQRITGKSYRQSIRLLDNLKRDFNKPKSSLISVIEFCEYTGLKVEHVEPHII